MQIFARLCLSFGVMSIISCAAILTVQPTEAAPATSAATPVVPAPSFAGCYQRLYNSAHLFAHEGQIVERVSLAIALAKTPDRGKRPIIASATLKLVVHGATKSFDSIGACWKDGEALLCNGSLSAAESDRCRSKEDGIHDCRIGGNNAGAFRIESKPEGLLVSIVKQLELVNAPYDGGPFLYLSPKNAENHAFLLESAADAAVCASDTH